jgi:hypothetical protein
VAEPDVWVLSLGSMRLLRIVPATGAVLETIPLTLRLTPVRSMIIAWWLTAAADGTLWATHPDFDAVTRTGGGRTATVPTRRGRPFGIATDDRSVWVGTDRAVIRIDPGRAVVTGAGRIPAQAGSGFVSMATGAGAAWLAAYATDELYRVTD